MSLFAIIEVDDGLAIAEVASNETPENAASSKGGTLIDPGPYYTFQEAYDAMLAIEDEIEESE
jgi:hypothetical protein